MTPLRVAFFVTYFPKHSEVFILHQALALLDRGHEVRIHALADPGDAPCHAGTDRFRPSRTVTGRMPSGGGRALRTFRALPAVLARVPWRDAMAALNVNRWGHEALTLHTLFRLDATPGRIECDVAHAQFGDVARQCAFLGERGRLRAFGRDHPLVAAELAALAPNIRARVNRDGGTEPSTRPRTRQSPPASRSWAARLGFLRAFVAAGGRVAVASGATSAGWPLPGMAIRHEIALLVTAGLSPLDALRAATVWPADMLQADRRAGLTPGGTADFFAVRGDPLADVGALADIALIVRGGERLERDDLLAHALRATRRVK